MASVLLVDDSMIVREWVGAILSDAGHQVALAENGQQALDLVARGEPDVMVCDLHMPGLDGLQVLRALRERAPLVPALMFTDAEEVSICATAMREGALGYVLKSAPPEMLLQEIEGAVQSRRLRVEHAALQTAHAEHQRHLEALVEQKSRELLRLQHARSQAEKLEALGTLVSGVAHEVNNPLAAAKTNVNWLSEVATELIEAARPTGALAEDAASLKQVVKETLESLERIARIVKALRRIARTGQRTTRCHVDEAGADAEGSCTGPLFEKVSLLRSIDAGLEVPLSREDLTVVLVNVLQNAAFAVAGKGSGRVALMAQRLADGEVQIEVRDTGCGIPAEQLDRVCDPFFTTRQQGEGTGLGLTLVRQIIDAAGGALQIESVVGEGTVVRLTLPAPVGDSLPVTPTAQSRLHA
jgi:two-component system NtrC family sensor kinase